MAGRPRKPTNLKVLKGTQRKSRINPNEPEPELKIPSAPDFLNDEALKEWYRVTKVLSALGLLTEIDGTMLALYAQSYARMVKYEAIVAKNGELYKTKNGSVQLSPAMWIINRCHAQIHKYLTEFGMSPAARSKVSGQKSESKNENPFSKIANK